VNGDSGKVHADSGVMNSDSGHGAELWHFEPEIAVTINQNQRSRSARMGVNDEPEYARATNCLNAIQIIRERYAGFGPT